MFEVIYSNQYGTAANGIVKVKLLTKECLKKLLVDCAMQLLPSNSQEKEILLHLGEVFKTALMESTMLEPHF